MRMHLWLTELMSFRHVQKWSGLWIIKKKKIFFWKSHHFTTLQQHHCTIYPHMNTNTSKLCTISTMVGVNRYGDARFVFSHWWQQFETMASLWLCYKHSIFINVQYHSRKNVERENKNLKKEIKQTKKKNVHTNTYFGVMWESDFLCNAHWIQSNPYLTFRLYE